MICDQAGKCFLLPLHDKYPEPPPPPSISFITQISSSTQAAGLLVILSTFSTCIDYLKNSSLFTSVFLLSEYSALPLHLLGNCHLLNASFPSFVIHQHSTSLDFQRIIKLATISRLTPQNIARIQHLCCSRRSSLFNLFKLRLDPFDWRTEIQS